MPQSLIIQLLRLDILPLWLPRQVRTNRSFMSRPSQARTNSLVFKKFRPLPGHASRFPTAPDPTFINGSLDGSQKLLEVRLPPFSVITFQLLAAHKYCGASQLSFGT